MSLDLDASAAILQGRPLRISFDFPSIFKCFARCAKFHLFAPIRYYSVAIRGYFHLSVFCIGSVANFVAILCLSVAIFVAWLFFCRVAIFFDEGGGMTF